ncbi:radical SAM protein [Bacillus sp. FJAT-29790]|uniref:radical SAM protein n=1 Tax=Bacillus sp. FJAT-29790 TaxID=1895002 RepID=UPI001C22809F|nr:radical SAM protein [Bacillus sp. FJAT-29790]MBU8879631.1 radical SAM protein [Bacillus sp. FJAT-29790]
MIMNFTDSIIPRIKNKALIDYSHIYFSIKNETLNAIESFGLPLEKAELAERRKRKQDELRASGALFRNNNKSIVSNGRISSACEACQTGTGSYTTFVSLKCHRDCYFCFNENQDNYSFYVSNHKNVNKELTELLASGVHLKHLALTGGEPLLHKAETINFIRLANELTPETYTRLYTAGDLLDVETLQSLKEYGLDEIRISIKMDDSQQKRKHVLSKIALAKEYIPKVLVEMPVIPGTTEEMNELLLELDELEIFGINLLEFCFPLGNAKAFQTRGFELKNPPYEVFYNYWYAGGLAVAQSEQICLELVEFAMEKKLKLGVHYCSLENKFTGQIYQQNYDQKLSEMYTFSEKDYFWKTAKAFGKDQKKVQSILEQHQIPFEINETYNFIQFPIHAIQLLGKNNLDLIISSNVLEHKENETEIREVNIEWTTPSLFEEIDI